MSKRDIGSEILESISEIKSHKKGEITLITRKLSMPSHPKIIRGSLDLTQEEFAALMGVSVRTIQDWEQNRRSPRGPAITLLRIAEQYPNVFLNLKTA